MSIFDDLRTQLDSADAFEVKQVVRAVLDILEVNNISNVPTVTAVPQSFDPSHLAGQLVDGRAPGEFVNNPAPIITPPIPQNVTTVVRDADPVPDSTPPSI